VSQSALRSRLLIIVALSGLALVLQSAAGASAAGQPLCFASLGPPPGLDGRFQVEAGDVRQGIISCSKDEGADLSFSVLVQPDHGSLSSLQENPSFPGSESASFTYAPEVAYRGEDEFTLHVSDGANNTDVAVRVNVVEPVDDPPQCSASLFGPPIGAESRYQVEAGDTTRGAMGCSDDERANLTFSVVHGPDHGTLSALEESPPFSGFESVSFTYIPDAAYRGPDEFTLRASDGMNAVEAVVKVNAIEPVNDPPHCFAGLTGVTPGLDGRFPAEAGEAELGGISCSDDEGVTPSLSVVDQPDHGTLSALQEAPGSPGFRSASFTYTPDGSYRGSDEFTLRGSDGTKDTDVVVRVNVVEAVNEPPECFVPGTIPVEQGQTLTFDAETACSDPEGEPLTLTITNPPDHGAIAGPDGDGFFTYTAPSDYLGPDSFDVEISDGVKSITGTVNIQVIEATGGGGGGGDGGGAGGAGGGGAAGGGAAGAGGGGGGGGAATGPTVGQVIASVVQETAQAGKMLEKCGTTRLLAKAGCIDSFTALKGGTVVYRVTAPTAGAGAAATIVVASGKRTIQSAGTYKVTIKATSKGRRRLKKARKLNGKLTVTFTDSDGNVATKSKKVLLKRKKR
jgi:hypothetical protein